MSAPADIRLVLSLAAAPGASGYRMHNAGYKALGLDYLYLPRRFEGDIARALEAVRTLGIRGVSLTMPFKISSLPHLDALSPAAKAIGAVNTVVNDGGKLTGHNTDAPAAKRLIEEHLPWQKKSWVILGSGGMAHAFAYVAKEMRAHASICARNQKNAEVLAKKFGLETMVWGKEEWDGKIVCNATPIGMASGDKNPVPQNRMNVLSGVFEAVANPAETPLVKAAKAGALPVVSGDMLSLEQACLQFKLYTGMEPPTEVMRKAMYQHD